jgi:peptidoglycan/xylan/chitin deacetylase (PgdA/CDA1 family)
VTRRVLIGTGVGLAAGALVHGAPIATSIQAVRTWIFPGLAGVTTPGRVALTFDDGPDPASTPKIVDVLDQLGWKATFFMLGSMASRAPGVAADVAGAGHEVAVHGHAHKNHLRLTPMTIFDDINRGRDEVEAATGSATHVFRPPYGALTTWTLLACRKAGMKPVLWTAWGRDWRADGGGAEVAATVLRGRCDGGTVLLHDSDCTSAPLCWRATIDALPRLAEVWARQGLTVGPLDMSSR